MQRDVSGFASKDVAEVFHEETGYPEWREGNVDPSLYEFCLANQIDQGHLTRLLNPIQTDWIGLHVAYKLLEALDLDLNELIESGRLVVIPWPQKKSAAKEMVLARLAAEAESDLGYALDGLSNEEIEKEVDQVVVRRLAQMGDDVIEHHCAELERLRDERIGPRNEQEVRAGRADARRRALASKARRTA